MFHQFYSHFLSPLCDLSSAVKWLRLLLTGRKSKKYTTKFSEPARDHVFSGQRTSHLCKKQGGKPSNTGNKASLLEPPRLVCFLSVVFAQLFDKIFKNIINFVKALYLMSCPHLGPGALVKVNFKSYFQPQ